MLIVDHIEYWLLTGLLWAVTVFMLWAFVDCASRKAPAFPAAGKLTKPAWLALTGVPALIGVLFSLSSTGSVQSLLIFIAVIISSVYMADVRPAVKEISGPSRW